VGSDDGNLYAFDAAGVAGCSGVPKMCAPLWTATTGGAVHSSPAVANGVVYVGSDDGNLYAFDAAGVAGCSGVPKMCAPLWTAPTGGAVHSSPAVANGVVYVGSDDGNLYAFDAAGVAGCSGVPKMCAPLWTAPAGGAVDSSPALANGVVYVGSLDGNLYVFDAAGVAGCSGVPKMCAPLWTAPAGGAVRSSPAISKGVVYVGSDDANLYAFDATGVTGCSGVPKTCTPLWTAATGGPVRSSPAVANGVVYVGSSDQKLYAFDGSGVTDCAGLPKSCTPLWTTTTGGAVNSSPAIANALILVGSADDTVDAFTLEKVPPQTSVVSPTTGSMLSGVTLLTATATDNATVSGVEFHLTDAANHDFVIGVASRQPSDWEYSWDSSFVPNGTYTLTSVATDAVGNKARSAPVTITTANDVVHNVDVYVGYANNLEQLPVPAGAFPSPWQGSPNVSFVGCSCLYDAGAMRFDNVTDGSITVANVTVQIGPYSYNIWPATMTISANQSLILTQTTFPTNFDTSDTPTNNCIETGYDAVINATIDGAARQFYDVNQVLNTGGIDGKCKGNESRPWSQVLH
jgi:outer membrane protein assembly factor BamB